MSIEMTILIVLGGFLLLLALGTEIAVAIGVMSVIGFLFIVDQPLAQIARTAFHELNHWVLTAVPLFIFMGTMLGNTGVVRSLFDGAEKLIGGLPGGLASAVIGADALFGAMSGSAIAAAATFGTVAYPEMERKKYHQRLALGAILVGGTLAVLIPPSILLIIFGALQGVSIVRLFAAALIPGVILAFLLILTVVIMVKLNPSMAPKPAKSSWKEKLSAIKELLPWLGIIGVVLGVIFGGIMTPTESAALGAFISIVVAAAYRKFTWAALKDSLLTTVKITSMIAFLIAVANMFSFVFHASGISDTFKEIFVALPLGKYGGIALIYILYFILGMFLDDLSMLILTLLFVVPVIRELGFKPLWFGVVYVVTAEIALVTPPFGPSLFALKGVIPKHDIMEIAISALYFIPALLLLLVLLTAFPDLALWLPSILHG